jgi:hypothetical protein
MAIDGKKGFSPDIAAKLLTYVYRLIDPRNGETFYVGKGNGNRVFAHARAEENQASEGHLDQKLQRIRDIRLSGFEVAHVIHRHGMNDATAGEVEAALIDAYPGLTNAVGGVGVNDFGVMHAIEIINRYEAVAAEFKHKALLITVNRSVAERDLYDATRYAWRIKKSHAEQAEVVLSVAQGMIRGAFEPVEWRDATPENFPGFPHSDDTNGRVGFVGKRAAEDLWQCYVGKGVPERYRRRGAANPVRYTWK